MHSKVCPPSQFTERKKKPRFSLWQKAQVSDAAVVRKNNDDTIMHSPQSALCTMQLKIDQTSFTDYTVFESLQFKVNQSICVLLIIVYFVRKGTMCKTFIFLVVLAQTLNIQTHAIQHAVYTAYNEHIRLKTCFLIKNCLSLYKFKFYYILV